jgi:hypothetical protein
MYVILAYMEIEQKTCSRCDLPKSFDDFYDNSKAKDGKSYWCKDCALDDAKERYKRKTEADPEFPRRRYLKYLIPTEKRRAVRREYVYGTTPSDVEGLIAKQGGVCAVCGRPIEKGKEVIDHNHDTGKVRGVLHHRCNMVLGFLYESADLCRRAAEYLDRDGNW